MLARRVFSAILIGTILQFVVSLHPVAWLAWLAPAPLLVLALRSPGRQAAALTFLAALIGQGANYAYYRSVMPLLPAVWAMVGMSLVWVLVVGASRRVMLHYRAWWTVFAYPALWVAMDTLTAHLLPDGNWGSLAYSQAEVLPILQVASLFGLAGVLFLISLVPATLAAAFVFGREVRRPWLAPAVTAVLLLAALGYGALRLGAPATGEKIAFGMVAIDDFIGMKTSGERVASIWQGYDQQIVQLAAQGATVIVLPEKIGQLGPARAAEWQRHLGELAARNHVWIAAGVGVQDEAKKLNLEWLFSPQGQLSASYQKHHMAPPERDNLPGFAYDTRQIGGATYGLAICKDMHFAAMGRAYAQRGAGVMLIPAWDFGRDAWLAARMTATRGVESGFTVVRSSKEGMLTLSDPYGRILAERPSAALPGASLLATAAVGAPVATLYGRTGDLLGWLCVVVSFAMLSVGRGRKTATPASA